MKPLPPSANHLTWVAIAGTATASFATLKTDSSFPLSSPAPSFNGALAEARGWSVVTILLVLPLLRLGWVKAGLGSLPGRLVWLGTLTYLVYTYLELSVSPPFTALYLVYIVTFACSLVALIIGTASVDTRELVRAFSDRAPRRSVAAFGLLVALFLTVAWLKVIGARTVAGDFGWPTGEAAIGHVVHALDLGLQVPLCIAAAVLLLRKRAGGYVVAAIMLVNSVCMGAALTAMVAASALRAGRSVLACAPFAGLSVIAAALAFAFFRAMHPSPHKDQEGPRARPRLDAHLSPRGSWR
jgi:hypothetical protein